MKNSGLIDFLSYQKTAFWQKMRILFFVWARQRGKSYMFAAKAWERMLKNKGRSVFIVSASILMGTENIRKEAEIWHTMLDKMRINALALGGKMDGTAYDHGGLVLPVDDIASILERVANAKSFEHAKLEARFWHDRSTYSRTRIVSANPDTARGYSGDVFADEIAFFQDFQATWDAIYPIISRQKDYLFWCATTPPYEDSHPTYDILCPPHNDFPVNPEGNFYQTENGYYVHRVDVRDAEAAGLPFYDDVTGAVIDIDTARARALNKASFDRNFLLKFLRGGATAIPRERIIAAQERGYHLGSLAYDLAGDIMLP